MYQQLMYQQLMYQQLVYQQLMYQQLVYQQLMYQQLMYQQLMYQQLMYQQLMYQQLMYQQLMYQQPRGVSTHLLPRAVGAGKPGSLQEGLLLRCQLEVAGALQQQDSRGGQARFVPHKLPYITDSVNDHEPKHTVVVTATAPGLGACNQLSKCNQCDTANKARAPSIQCTKLPPEPTKQLPAQLRKQMSVGGRGVGAYLC
jgi:hypothetical protein